MSRWIFAVNPRSALLKNFSRGKTATSFAVNLLDHATRALGFAPGPVDLYSPNHGVFSRAGSLQLSQPSGLMCAPNQQSMKTTRAYGRHGRPSYTPLPV